ncbi:hypothetical protein LMP27_14200 [Staphylococcus aureus]|nr:hypothetical protein [Staphylococcus aureus]MCC5389233.1 hypothetical protein [Staphylococcus aureus]MCC5389239.1 hypothetical protein [Staphylococcus aureus]MCC5392000.1 hypothetical protein [Staphylococcus aureus]MCC5392006.1 hypothetical protein [Staphylococcus aureus]
MFYKEYFYGE